MKIISTISLLFYFALINTSIAQNQFEGKIVYDMAYPTTMELDSQTMKMAPKEKMIVTLFLKGNKMRMETSVGKIKNVNIFDAESGISTELMNVKGRKTALLTSRAEMEEEEDKHTPAGERIKIKQPEETKEIAGYLCKKEEIVFSKNATEKLNIYYTDKIKSDVVNENISWIQKRCKGIPGLVLDYEITDGKNVIYKVTAQQITAEPIADNYFTVPSGYKIEKHKGEKE